MWPFKKQEVDTATIPDVVWANKTASKIRDEKEIKDTKSLLRFISTDIENAVALGKMKINIPRRWLNMNYTTPHHVLYDNVKGVLTQYGYKISQGTNADYYIVVAWGDELKCPDFNFTKPTTKPSPGPRNKVGE